MMSINSIENNINYHKLHLSFLTKTVVGALLGAILLFDTSQSFANENLAPGCLSAKWSIVGVAGPDQGKRLETQWRTGSGTGPSPEDIVYIKAGTTIEVTPMARMLRVSPENQALPCLGNGSVSFSRQYSDISGGYVVAPATGAEVQLPAQRLVLPRNQVFGASLAKISLRWDRAGTNSLGFKLQIVNPAWIPGAENLNKPNPAITGKPAVGPIAPSVPAVPPRPLPVPRSGS